MCQPGKAPEQFRCRPLKGEIRGASRRPHQLPTTNHQLLTTSHQIGLDVFRLQARPLGDA